VRLTVHPDKMDRAHAVALITVLAELTGQRTTLTLEVTDGTFTLGEPFPRQGSIRIDDAASSGDNAAKASTAAARKTLTGSTFDLNNYFKDNGRLLYTGQGGTLTVTLNAVPTATPEPVGVQSIFVTSPGSGYTTALPTVTLSAPDAAGGQQAKAAATDPVMFRVIDEQLIEMLGEEKSRLPFIDPNPQVGRTYADGEEINSNLPDAYQPAANADVPEGQNCGNCEYYKPGELYCTKFDAPVRAVYWCAKWEPVEEEY
jgi:hypothetical protein